MYRVAADIGGTFTDFVIEDQKSGEIKIGKVPTTPENPARGILNGVSQLIGDPEDIEFFVHGTTVGLNAFLERKGARVLLVMTSGISDTYTIARGHREELYKLHYRKPKQLVPRKDVHEVSERLGWDGSVVTPLDESSLQPIIEKVKAENIDAKIPIDRVIAKPLMGPDPKLNNIIAAIKVVKLESKMVLKA